MCLGWSWCLIHSRFWGRISTLNNLPIIINCLSYSVSFCLTREKRLCKRRGTTEGRGDTGVTNQIQNTTGTTEKLLLLWWGPLGQAGSCLQDVTITWVLSSAWPSGRSHLKTWIKSFFHGHTWMEWPLQVFTNHINQKGCHKHIPLKKSWGPKGKGIQCAAFFGFFRVWF